MLWSFRLAMPDDQTAHDSSWRSNGVRKCESVELPLAGPDLLIYQVMFGKPGRELEIRPMVDDFIFRSQNDNVGVRNLRFSHCARY